MDGKVGKTIFDVSRDDVNIQGLYAKNTTWNVCGFVIDNIFVPLTLTWRVDG
jgi:hypothetical protein